MSRPRKDLDRAKAAIEKRLAERLIATAAVTYPSIVAGRLGRYVLVMPADVNAQIRADREMGRER